MSDDIFTLQARLRKMDDEQWRMARESLVLFIKSEDKRRSAIKKVQFSVGDRVSWVGKRGYRITGVVVSLARKYIHVDAGAEGKWRVAPTMLQKEAK